VYDEQTELELLQREAKKLGLYANRHLKFDPTYGTGEYYLMPRKIDRKQHVDSILKYVSMDEIWEYINHEKQDRKIT
jgi:hypothetical protein